jgi:hypothetical protein
MPSNQAVVDEILAAAVADGTLWEDDYVAFANARARGLAVLADSLCKNS